MANFPDLLDAVMRGDIFSVMGLMWRGLDINCRDSMNRTILHHWGTVRAPWLYWAGMVVPLVGLGPFVGLGADINAVDMFGRTPLHTVILTDNMREDKIFETELLVELGADVNATLEPGLTSLHRAIQQQNMRGIEVLLSLGVDVNTHKYFLFSALDAALAIGKVELAKVLIKLGAEINSHYSSVVPIIQAVESGRLDILKVLIENGADLNGKRFENMTLVMTATEIGNHEMTEWLAASGADLNAISTMSSVSHEVIRLGRVDMLECLVKAGLDLVLRCHDGVEQKTALTIAIDKKDLVLAEILLTKGADVNLRCTQMYNFFFTAMRQGDVAMVKALVRLGVDINVVRLIVNTIFFNTAGTTGPDMLKLLLKFGGDVHSKNDKYLKPIHDAVALGDIGMLKILAELGANMNVGRPERADLLNTLIILKQDHLTRVKILVEAGIDINMGYNDAVTALHDAMRLGKTEMVKILHELGADINYGKLEGMTPLVTAIKNGREDIVRYLISKGADINVQYLESTPLHDAVRLGNIEMVDALIKAGASNAYGKRTLLALQDAIGLRDCEMVRCLLECGANVNMKQTVNISPQHDAVHYANTDMIVLTNCPGGQYALEGMTPLLHSVAQDVYEITETLLIAGADVTSTTFGVSPLGWAVRQRDNDCIWLLLALGQERCKFEWEMALHQTCRNGFIDLARLLIIKESDVSKPDYLGKKPLEYLPLLDTVDYHVLQEASSAVNVVEEVQIETVSVDKCQEMTTLCHTPGIGNATFLPKLSSREIYGQVTHLLEELAGTKWRVKGIGSAAEGTKVGFPNEMDFMFQMKMESIEEEDIVNLGHWYANYQMSAADFPGQLPPMCRGSSFFVHVNIVLYIMEHVTRLLGKNQYKNISPLGTETVRATNRKASSIVQLEWKDESARFVIFVDIVPSLHVDHWPEGGIIKTWLMDERELQSRGYYLVPKPPHVKSELAKQFTEEACQTAWKISFPHLETEHMQRLEQRIKDVYLTAKCLRNPDVCRILILEEGKLPRPVDKYITSYQLKMCFFQNVEHFLETDLSLEEMVCKVYNDLEDGLSKGFIPLFFLPKVSALAGTKLDIPKCSKVAKIIARFVRGLYLRDRRSDSCEFTTDEDQEVVVYQRKPGAVYNTYRI